MQLSLYSHTVFVILTPFTVKYLNMQLSLNYSHTVYVILTSSTVKYLDTQLSLYSHTVFAITQQHIVSRACATAGPTDCCTLSLDTRPPEFMMGYRLDLLPQC